MQFLKHVAQFTAKSVGFTIIFWVVWLYILRPQTAASQSNQLVVQGAQAQKQLEAYDKQMARANQQLDVVEKQQRRTELLLSHQEESSKRFDAVLDAWEKQNAKRK